MNGVLAINVRATRSTLRVASSRKSPNVSPPLNSGEYPNIPKRMPGRKGGRLNNNDHE